MAHESRNNTNNTGSRPFSYGAGPSWREPVVVPQHSTLQAANPLDLTSAIAHELQRSNSTPPGWQYAWSHPSPQEPANGLLQQQQLSFGASLSENGNPNASRGLSLPQYYIPRFEEALGPAASLHYQQTELQDYSTKSASLASAHHQGLFSRSSEFPSQQHGRVDSTMRAAVCSPWIERMMQADVTPTPCPSLGISTSLSLAQRAVGDVSCVASATVDLQSDVQQLSENQSMRSAFNCDPLQCESTMEISADMCTDDEDLETRPVDEKRKRRMLSNRASAQRSRQRRQERLDQLEVLTAQLRVENSALQKKLSTAIQVAKKLEDHNTNLLKKVDKLTKELDAGKPEKAMAAAAFDECASSQQTTCASSCEMVGGQTSVDLALIRDGKVNDGASTPSMSAGSPGCPSGSCPNENEMDFATSHADNNNRTELSPVHRLLSACRVGKRESFGEPEIAGDALFGGSRNALIGNVMGLASFQPNRPRPSPTGGETNGFSEPGGAFANSFGLDPTLEADRWLEFAECFK